LQILDLLQTKTLQAETERHALRRMVFHALVLKRADESLFRPFVRALKTVPPDVRAVLAEVLPRLPPAAEQGDLVELLRHADADVRGAAARVLSGCASKQSIGALAAMVQERGFIGQREALEVILRFTGPQALPLLEKLLQRSDVGDRLLAIRWLGDAQHMGRSGAPAALRVLQPLLRDGNDSVVVAAATAIGQLVSEPEYHALLGPLVDGKNLRLAATVLEGLRRFPSSRSAELLERKLASGPQVLRIAALNCVEGAAALAGLAPTPVDIDPLLGVVVSGLGHPQVAVRNRAAEVMAALSRNERIELGRTIVWLLRSGDVTTRRMAAEVLRSVKDPHGEVWPKLIGSLRDDDWWVRDRVMDALVEIAGKGLSRYMLAWLQDKSDVVRRFALHVLLRLKDPETIAAVVHCARTDPDWWAREKAIEVIAEFNDPRAVPTIVELMGQAPELQVACVAALRKLAPQQAGEFLIPLAGSTESDVRLLVLGFIEQHNDPAHFAIVERLRDDPDASVRRVAATLSARWRVTRRDQRVDEAVPASVGPREVDGDERPLDSFLAQLTESGGDLILSPDRHVVLKRDGHIEAISTTALSADRVAAMLAPLVTTQAALRLEQRKDADFSVELKALDQRFRVNMFRQRGGLGAVFRAIRSSIPALEELGLPPAVLSLTSMRTGLVLVGGAPASGKSTTLAAFIDRINRTERRHVISLEDPIEILHQPRLALVQQRELGAHTRSFSRALRSALREDPDVIVIGEMRDKETIELALTAAETGHLVIGTMHTSSAEACIDRILNVFPGAQRDTIRASLADSLRAVLFQTLLRRRAGTTGPRLLAAELLLNNDAVAHLIRKNKTVQIPSILATSREAGMVALDVDLVRLARSGCVDDVDVVARARNKTAVEAALAELRTAPRMPVDGRKSGA
jgi:twitching motility protein PilT